MQSTPTDLTAVLKGGGAAPPGVELRRSNVWKPLASLLLLAAAVYWLFDAVANDRINTSNGKSLVAVGAAPFLLIWWLWQTLRAVLWRVKGSFAWAVSDTHLVFADPFGGSVGPLPLSAITALTYDFGPPPAGGASVVIEYTSWQGGAPVPQQTRLHSLQGHTVLAMLTAPSDGLQFFDAVRVRLTRVNPNARVYSWRGGTAGNTAGASATPQAPTAVGAPSQLDPASPQPLGGSTMTRVHFNALPLASRERLAAALTGTPPRGALAWTPSPDPDSARDLGWFGIVFLAIFTCFLFTRSVGDVTRDDAFLGAPGALAFAASLFLCVWWSLRSIHRRITRVKLPAPPGTYLLPLDIVVFDEATLSIHPLQAMQGCRATDFFVGGAYRFTQLEIVLPSGAFAFQTTQQQAADIQRRLREFDQRLREATARGDGRTLHELDPLYDARSSPGWPPPAQGLDATPPSPSSGPVVVDRKAPAWLRRPGIPAAAFTLLAAPAMCFARNYQSDEAMMDVLRVELREDLCQRYLSLEGRHVDEVRTTVLPASVLRVTARSSVAGQREFIRRFPQSPLARGARVRIHELFGEARTNWQRQAATGSPELVPFMTRLLAWEEAHDSPKVRVRFFPPASDSLALVDRLAAQSPRLQPGHTVAPIAPHFADAAMRPREGGVVTALSNAFRRVFQEGVLSLEDGGRLSGGAPPPDNAPVFDVSYLVTPSGAEYHIDTLPTRSFIGMTFTFRVTMRIPDGGAPYTFTTFASPDRHFTFRREAGVAPTDAFIYGVMSDNAFERLSRSFRLVFFQPTPADLIAERNAAAGDTPDRPAPAETPTRPDADDAGSGRRHRRHRRHH